MRIFILLLITVFVNKIDCQDVVQDYVDRFSPMAMAENQRTGIPASIKLAQGILESDCGRSELAIFAHNHFAIKCSSNWLGRTYYKQDDDIDDNGDLIESCFRVFESESDSYTSHSEFLLNNQRYAFLFDYAQDDYKSWAHGLRKAGYATDPHYPNKLIKIIEKHNLHEFDMPSDDNMLASRDSHKSNPTKSHSNKKETIENTTKTQQETLVFEDEADENQDFTTNKNARIKKSTKNKWSLGNALDGLVDKIDHTVNEVVGDKVNTNSNSKTRSADEEIVRHSIDTVETINGTPVHLAQNDQTLREIALRYNLEGRFLANCNNYAFRMDEKLPEGTKVYLAKKSNGYSGVRSEHKVSEGEKLVDIAQNYGINESFLRKINYLESNEEPTSGEIVQLKDAKLTSNPRTLAPNNSEDADDIKFIFPKDLSKK